MSVLTFVGIRRKVGILTFWRYVFAWNWIMILNNSPIFIELCAVSLNIKCIYEKKKSELWLLDLDLKKKQDVNITKNISFICTKFYKFIFERVDEAVVLRLFFCYCAIFRFCYCYQVTTILYTGSDVPLFFWRWAGCHDFDISNSVLATFTDTEWQLLQDI